MLESKKTDNILEEIIPNAFTFKMVKVEGGTFSMGDNDSKTEGEKRVHKVTIPDFYISPYTVTNAQYAVFLNDYGSDRMLNGEYEGKKMVYEHNWGMNKRGKDWYAATGFEQHPIINVTWYGAVEYCNWLSQKTEQSYRLPSESEWEFAARGGNKSLGFQYAGSHKLKEVGWFKLNSFFETKPVGLKLPNELGLYDMSGNIWEWCADNWEENYEYTALSLIHI